MHFLTLVNCHVRGLLLYPGARTRTTVVPPVAVEGGSFVIAAEIPNHPEPVGACRSRGRVVGARCCGPRRGERAAGWATALGDGQAGDFRAARSRSRCRFRR